MKARDVMTSSVVSIDPESSIVTAIRLMLQKRISGLPVVDTAGNLVGIVSEGDFLRRAEIGTQYRQPRWIEFLMGPGALADQYVHATGRKIKEIMTSNVRTVSEETPLPEVVEMMERHRVKRLPVLCEGKLVGIVTRANLIRALASVVNEVPPSLADDASIRERLLTELRKQTWAPLAMIDVTVRNGVISFSGCVLDERQRQALRVTAENIPGVTKIEDHLVWIEPISGTVIESTEDRPSAGTTHH